MDLEHHADRFYKSLCLCDFPLPGASDRTRCDVCGGIIRPYSSSQTRWLSEELLNQRRPWTISVDIRWFLTAMILLWAVSHWLRR